MVTGHDSGAVFVTAHDDFQQVFAGVFGQLLQSHVIDDDEVGFQVFAQRLSRWLKASSFRNDQIEDGTVEHQKVLTDGLVTNGLGQMGFADARWTEEQHIFGFADKPALARSKISFLWTEGLKLQSKSSRVFAAEVRQLGVVPSGVAAGR